MKKKKLLLTSLLLGLSTICLATTATFASFIAMTRVGDNDFVVGSKGDKSMIRTIYFNANGNYWDRDGAIMYMKRYNSAQSGTYAAGKKTVWVPVSKVINPTVGGSDLHLHCFQYDITDASLDKFVFVRFNPNGVGLDLSALKTVGFDFDSSVWNKANKAGDDGTKIIWNNSKEATRELDNTQALQYSYYVINSYNPNDSNSLMKRKLNYNSGTWSWSGGGDTPV